MTSSRIPQRVTLGCLCLLVACGGKPKPGSPGPQAASTPTGSMGPSSPGDASTAPTMGDAAAAEAARRREAASRARAVLEQRVYFDFDRAELSSAARETLTGKLEVLRNFAGVQLTIAGHADERGSDEYNLALGNRRAAAVKQFLVLHGVASSRMQSVSYGEEQPAVNGAEESAWSRNRRAEFSITSGLD